MCSGVGAKDGGCMHGCGRATRLATASVALWLLGGTAWAAPADDRPPATPTAVTVIDAHSYAGALYLASAIPAFSVAVTDPDGDDVSARFTVTGGASPLVLTSEPAPSGSAVTAAAADPLPDGRYTVSARAYAGERESTSGPVTAFVIDTAVPNAPTVKASSAQVTAGTVVKLTFGAASPDVVGYRWELGGITATVAAARPGASAQVSFEVPYGVHQVTVVALDRAGNRSAASSTVIRAVARKPAHRYRLDRSGRDAVGTARSVDLAAPSSTRWDQGRDYWNDDEARLRDCTDAALRVSPSARIGWIGTPKLGFDTRASFTVAGWLKPLSTRTTRTGTGYEAMAISLGKGRNAAAALGYRKPTASSPAYWIAMVDRNTELGYRSFVHDPATREERARVQVGRWAQVALAWDARASTARVYLDGEPIASRVLAESPYAASGIRLGSAAFGSRNLQWNGLIDEVRLYPGALGEDELRLAAAERRPSKGC